MRAILLLVALTLPSSAHAVVAYAPAYGPGGFYYQRTTPYFYAPYYPSYGYGYISEPDSSYELRRIRWQMEDDAYERRWRHMRVR